MNKKHSLASVSKKNKAKGDSGKKEKRGNRVSFLLLMLFNILSTAAFMVVFFFMTCRSNNDNSKYNLANIVNDKHRYFFLEDPTENINDLYGAVNSYNHTDFNTDDVTFKFNLPGDDSFTMYPVDKSKYNGEITLHYNISQPVYLDVFISNTDIGSFYENPNINDVIDYTITVNEDSHTADEWAAFRNAVTTQYIDPTSHYASIIVPPDAPSLDFQGYLMVHWEME
ncbi:hypothetical protein FACS1894218_6440 [Bacilli bacterium]|nr:hypothetical protein FACS1894218_6440 [Bacilli bacterium]